MKYDDIIKWIPPRFRFQVKSLVEDRGITIEDRSTPKGADYHVEYVGENSTGKWKVRSKVMVRMPRVHIPACLHAGMYMTFACMCIQMATVVCILSTSGDEGFPKCYAFSNKHLGGIRGGQKVYEVWHVYVCTMFARMNACKHKHNATHPMHMQAVTDNEKVTAAKEKAAAEVTEEEEDDAEEDAEEDAGVAGEGAEEDAGEGDEEVAEEEEEDAEAEAEEEKEEEEEGEAVEKDQVSPCTCTCIHSIFFGFPDLTPPICTAHE